jgi:hypothetical protein
MNAETRLLPTTHDRPAPTGRARLEIPLGRLNDPGQLTFAPGWDFVWRSDEGLQMVGSAHLEWAFLGIRSPVLMGSIALTVRPSLSLGPNGDNEVLLGLSVDDVSPREKRPLRERLIARLNSAIRAEAAPLPCPADGAIGRCLGISATLDALDAFGVHVSARRVSVTRDALALVASFAACEPDAFESLRQGEER